MTIISSTFSKKRRLLEAFIEVDKTIQNQNNQITYSTPKKIKLIEIKKEYLNMDCSTDTSELEKLYPIPPILSPRVLQLFNIKLQIFEKWELKKRKALEKIYENVDLLTNKEEKLKKLLSMQKEKERKRKELQKNVTIAIRTTTSNDNEKIPIISPNLLITKIHQQNNNIIKYKKQIQKPSSTVSINPITSFRNQNITSNKKITNEKFIPIGPNGTLVPEKILQLINWNQPTAATRKLLMTVFDRDTLAFHTLTGKPSPAFMGCGRPLKNQLNPKKVADIICIVTRKTKAPERDIRSAITTKCADENKMYKQRQRRKDKLINLLSTTNKENIRYSIHNSTI